MAGQPHYGARRDEAEPGVVAAFEAGGATVEKLNGKDIPDLLVGFLRETHLVEVKTNKAQLRDGQKRFAKTWLGSPPVVARTPAQARKWLSVWRERVEAQGRVGGGSWAAVEGVEDEQAERERRVKGEEPA